MFEHITARIPKLENMAPCNAEKVARMREKFRNAPSEYFDFMEQVGWGDIGGMMIYSGLIEPDELLAAIGMPSEKIVLFGDNWQGSRYGFDLDNGGVVVEITPEGELEEVDYEFIELMSKCAG